MALVFLIVSFLMYALYNLIPSDPARAELEAKYAAEVADGVNAAIDGNIDDVIEPAATRQMIAAALEMLSGKRESKPAKKHGNLPL